MKKEYVLKIVYDGKSDECVHLSEQFIDVGYCIEIDGEDIPISKETGEYMIEHVDHHEMGIG